VEASEASSRTRGETLRRLEKIGPERVAHEQPRLRQTELPPIPGEQPLGNKSFKRATDQSFDGKARLTRECVGIDPFQTAQAKHQPLAGALLRRKLFRLGDRRLASQHTANPGGRAAMIRLAPSCHIARRTGTGRDRKST